MLQYAARRRSIKSDRFWTRRGNQTEAKFCCFCRSTETFVWYKNKGAEPPALEQKNMCGRQRVAGSVSVETSCTKTVNSIGQKTGKPLSKFEFKRLTKKLVVHEDITWQSTFIGTSPTGTLQNETPHRLWRREAGNWWTSFININRQRGQDLLVLIFYSYWQNTPTNKNAPLPYVLSPGSTRTPEQETIWRAGNSNGTSCGQGQISFCLWHQNSCRFDLFGWKVGGWIWRP